MASQDAAAIIALIPILLAISRSASLYRRTAASGKAHQFMQRNRPLVQFRAGPQ
jgi:hypothetical protein